MSRDYLLYLEDMQTSCGKILRYTEDIDFDQFAADERTYDAVIFNLVILGEAAKHVPPVVRERYPNVPWRKVAGLRDISVHRYFGLDEEILWDILQKQIRPILDQINQILADEALFDSA
ncbi:MAG: DUF86 domain-containing protein [Methanothrix sp.]|jgi:uncharacterized protein with HEPN domain|nr:DUF86 domain-containing protein [Methanothrix sp.]